MSRKFLIHREQIRPNSFWPFNNSQTNQNSNDAFQSKIPPSNPFIDTNFILSRTQVAMATTFSYTACTKLSFLCPLAQKTRPRTQKLFSVSNSEQQSTVQEENQPAEKQQNQSEPQSQSRPLRPVEPQVNVKSKNMSREYGGQWLSSVTRHVRIYAAYIDPETSEFDQTQMDKLTLILDPTDEFVWSDESCNKVYLYFQDLIDHYEGAPLTEYTLRLIGSDIEHYIRKMLFNGEIQYNMDARVLNFSMGKPRIQFNNNSNNDSDNNSESKSDSDSDRDSSNNEAQLQDAANV